MTTTKKCPTGFNEMNPVHRTLMDLWEIADVYGVEPVAPKTWCMRWGHKGTKIESTMRRWERLKHRIRALDLPFEVKWVTVAADVKARKRSSGAAVSDTVSCMSAIGIQLPPGARAQLDKILDSMFLEGAV